MARACSFTATLAGLSTPPLLAVCVQNYTKVFEDDKWAIHYYAPIEGHELVCRRDLIPTEPDHPRARAWYYILQLGPLEHKLPPIVANRWWRVTFCDRPGPAGGLRFDAWTEPEACLREV